MRTTVSIAALLLAALLAAPAQGKLVYVKQADTASPVVYVATDNERPTKLALIEAADQVVLLADRSKFVASAPVLLCPHERITTLVTDTAPPPAAAEHLRTTGTTVLISA